MNQKKVIQIINDGQKFYLVRWNPSNGHITITPNAINAQVFECDFDTTLIPDLKENILEYLPNAQINIIEINKITKITMQTEEKPYGFICIKTNPQWPSVKCNDFEPYTTGLFLNYPLNWLPVYSKGINKTLGNTTANQAKANVKDIVFWGDGDTFKLICKASSKEEGWMKSTKAMEIEHVGCVIQVTTQQGSNVSEALTFVPGVKIVEFSNQRDIPVTSRKIVADK